MGESVDLCELWEKNCGLVYRECNRYRYHPDYEDLVQEGFLGLCAAAETYDPARGTFYNWALYYVRQKVRQYVMHSAPSVQVPFRFLPCVNKYRLAAFIPSAEDLQKEFGYTRKQAEAARRAIQVSGGTASLQAEIKNGEGATVQDSLADTTIPGPEECAVEEGDRAYISAAVKRAVRTLPPDEREIISRHYFSGEQYKDIAAAAGCLPGKVVRAKNRALKRLEKCQELAEYAGRSETIRSNGMKHTGAGSFNQTWTSATEREALRLIERGTRYM